MMKSRYGARGEEVYYAQRKEQIRRFWEPGIWHAYGMDMPARKDYLVQEFVQTPSSHYTHYRIFTAGGTVLGAVLCVSKRHAPRPHRRHPANAAGLQDVASNFSQDGTHIALMESARKTARAKPVSAHDALVLKAHGIDTEEPRLPSALRALAVKAAHLFSAYGILYSGQDWLQDRKGDFFFLEVNRYPGMELFNVLFNGGNGTGETSIRIGTAKIAEALIRSNEQSIHE